MKLWYGFLIFSIFIFHVKARQYIEVLQTTGRYYGDKSHFRYVQHQGKVHCMKPMTEDVLVDLQFFDKITTQRGGTHDIYNDTDVIGQVTGDKVNFLIYNTRFYLYDNVMSFLFTDSQDFNVIMGRVVRRLR